MGVQGKTRSGDIPSKVTKREVLGFIHSFYTSHDGYPTVDDIATKLGRSRKVMADFISRYARYGIVEAFKKQGEKTTYGPGVNWDKIDRLEWRDFFKAGKCPHCGHGGVIGFVGPKSVRYRCKWCQVVWVTSRDSIDKEAWDEIERQAQKTRKQWAHVEEVE